MISSYDDMGPRIDLGGETPPLDGPVPGRPAGSPRISGAPPTPLSSSSKKGSGPLGLLSLLLALAALVVAVWALMSRPEMIPPPPVSPSVVPGATAERVAKLEKDVGDLMLRMVTLEKEVKAVGSKAGSVTKLTELSNRVAGLQDRLDAMSVERKIAGMENKSAAPAAPGKLVPVKTLPPKQEAKAPAKAPAKAKEPEREKQTYTVRRGDTLFTIAQRYKVTMRDIKTWNNLHSNMVMIGQKLIIYK